MIKRFGQYIRESFGVELHYYAFDWDDNLLHMPTVIHMDQKSGDGWSPIDVSTSEFATVRNDKQNYRLRDDDPSLAFSEFRDIGPRGDKAFLEDSMDAINEKRFAPSWDAFIKCLSEGSIFAIITARGHEPHSIREAVEYIMDNVLTDDQKLYMYGNCLKHAYIFSPQEVDSFDRSYRDPISKTPLVKSYLDSCDFYGVSSPSFAEEFGASNAQNPEAAKQMALDRFMEKCNVYGGNIGAKSVSIGFSDDDVKNVDHVEKFFKEKSALSYDGPQMKLNVYNTNDRNIKGGTRRRFKEGDIMQETSNQAPGMESSVLPFTQFNNMTTRLYPNTKDAPTDDCHNQLKNQTKQATSLYKEFAYKRKKKK